MSVLITAYPSWAIFPLSLTWIGSLKNASRQPKYSQLSGLGRPELPRRDYLESPSSCWVYFFSPFPWDISDPRHLIGLADGLLYMALAALLWRNRKIIWADPVARTVLVLLSLVLVYGVAVGNFGTGLRHRSKLWPG
ncbi:hypothetical protein SAMN05660653_03265 [Desulfonatronum thiosulfatophilum]|uniref:Uncharacterized protein n=1 Tax=Desulfonatronum thiosulfatophilum TaxID=617002 RepID=A0A1G6EY38_9BACT|nr:hypothetical protein [Desulfonatronum thiosulfatophilum]SDB62212.1 hypothetical protein SAMN05660653_03265 [Desulfonatronum thiosulfatophilum]